MEEHANVPGYTYGSTAVAHCPVACDDFEMMKQSVLFSDEDVEYLHLSHDILKDEIEDILDVWYDFLGSQPQLVATFAGPDGEPIGEYLAAVRQRFGQWILDTARAEYDQRWLDYQQEIGLRHHRTKKNQTDGVSSTDIVPFRYLFLLIFPVTSTLKPFLARKGHSAEDVEKMHAAWVKSCLLQLTLWSYPYVKDGDF
ncbi:MAG TPA: protoglobin domain-containing protein [Phycisphaerae bacterium]|nr:protoglobin domain-containing protein [Phycisphaerae bacterium]